MNDEHQFPSEFGPYTLASLLGEGGMATVFGAVRTGPMGFRKELAIKRIRSDLTRNDDTIVKSLINEARLGGQLNHPNIVDTYEFGEIDGQYYIAMELVHGLTLSHLIEASGTLGVRLPRGVILDLGIQVCDGLHYAHEFTDIDGHALNLVHRDLKPANVIVSLAGQAKIMDFGIARTSMALFKTTTDDVTKGTIHYMSPEQLEDPGSLDHRSDLFALGAVLYEMATGAPLIQNDTATSAMWTIMSGSYLETLEQLGPVFPQLNPLVRRCLDPDRGERYPDASMLRRDLITARDSIGDDLGCRELMQLLTAFQQGDEPAVAAVEGLVVERGSRASEDTGWTTYIEAVKRPGVASDLMSRCAEDPTTLLSGVGATQPLASQAPEAVDWSATGSRAVGSDETISLMRRDAPASTRRPVWPWVAAALGTIAAVVLATSLWQGAPANDPSDDHGPPLPDPVVEGSALTAAVYEDEGTTAASNAEESASVSLGSLAEAEPASGPAGTADEKPAAVISSTPDPVEATTAVALTPVKVNSVPWSSWVLVNGPGGSGTTPFNREMPPGDYTFELTESQTGKSATITLSVSGAVAEVSRCWDFSTDGPCRR